MKKLVSILAMISFILVPLAAFSAPDNTSLAGEEGAKKEAPAQTDAPSATDESAAETYTEEEAQSPEQGIEELSESDWDNLPQEPR